MSKIQLLNADCMEVMAQYPDKYFDLAWPDPPYFNGPEKLGYYVERTSSVGVSRGEYKKLGSWQVPDNEFLEEVVRVSKHQIIWGINYYPFLHTPGRIVWDKCNGDSSFSDCEIASCSFHDSIRMFRYMWNGMMQGENYKRGWIQQGNKALNEKRIHPTQKPVALYTWLLENYAKPGQRILDTHLGSGSSAIAAHRFGVAEFIGCEIDAEYFEAARHRFQMETSAEYKAQHLVKATGQADLFLSQAS